MVRLRIALGMIVVTLLTAGCSSSGNKGVMQSYPPPAVEALWIRNGEPIIYDERKWFPRDDIEIFQDSEVALIGEYRGVQIFVEKTDVKPYGRLYTKFGFNQFRYYTLTGND